MAKRKTINKVMEGAVQKISDSSYQNHWGKLHKAVTSSIEKSLIKAILKKTDNNIFHAAEWLGVARNTLIARMKKYKIYKRRIRRKRKKRLTKPCPS